MQKMTCNICNQKYSIGGGLHRHLKKHNMTMSEYGMKYGDELQLYKEKSKMKRKINPPMCIEFYETRGYDNPTDALRKQLIYKDEQVSKNKFKNPCTYEYWVTRYGMTEKEATYAVSDFQKRGKLTSVSKSSIKFFAMLVETANMDINETLYGSRDNEFSLYDTVNDKVYYYDFKYQNVIIEYHGSAWHPNDRLLDTNEKKANWKQPRSNKTYHEITERDMNKSRVAIENGYDFIVIWDIDDIDSAYERIIKMIKIE